MLKDLKERKIDPGSWCGHEESRYREYSLFYFLIIFYFNGITNNIKNWAGLWAGLFFVHTLRPYPPSLQYLRPYPRPYPLHYIHMSTRARVYKTIDISNLTILHRGCTFLSVNSFNMQRKGAMQCHMYKQVLSAGTVQLKQK